MNLSGNHPEFWTNHRADTVSNWVQRLLGSADQGPRN